MKSLEKFIVSVKERFVELDASITDLEQREIELEQELSNNDFSVQAVKSTVDKRNELNVVSETLAKARAKRKELSAELSDDIAGLSQAISESKSLEDRDAIFKEIWEAATKIRLLIWEYRQNELAKEEKLKSLFAQIEDYYSGHSHSNFINSGMFSTAILAPCHQREGANYRLIRELSTDKYYRHAADQEFSQKGGD